MIFGKNEKVIASVVVNISDLNITSESEKFYTFGLVSKPFKINKDVLDRYSHLNDGENIIIEHGGVTFVMLKPQTILSYYTKSNMFGIELHGDVTKDNMKEQNIATFLMTIIDNIMKSNKNQWSVILCTNNTLNEYMTYNKDSEIVKRLAHAINTYIKNIDGNL